MSSDFAIAVNNLSKRYEIYSKPSDRLAQFLSLGKKRYFQEFWALRNVSFAVPKGETVGILGRNGSGKSTLLQLIAGTLMPTAGTVVTNGVLAALLELGSGFNPEFTGRENVYLNGAILGFTREQMDERFDKIARFADIGFHLDQPVKTYSSGMAVRLAFAVQACIEPQILIVDEALSVGDEKFQRKCFDYIERLRADGCSILLVTHSTATVEKFCQKAILMHQGEVHGIGEAKEIVDQYHALLYSDENVYLNYIRGNAKNDHVQEGAPDVQNQEIQSRESEDGTSVNSLAIIRKWGLFDATGTSKDNFRPADRVTISFTADVLRDVKELQAGILIRTVEGVSVFGTSTLYFEKNIINAKAGGSIQFDFNIELNLCAGTYFITLALADAISHADMQYLDRRTDVMVFKVSQPRLKASGIAMLKTAISTSFHDGSL
ncbi:ABC transporter ATP-binding protein [Ochrobactrum sp. GPK 3]|uniref:ABC transporter ATP-binding protein n=1 Tax=Brucella sp. 22210 TaxID=3453892 RepID=UPI003138556E